MSLIWTVVMIAVGLGIAGYVYHRWPKWFGGIVDPAASWVNKQIADQMESLKRG
jgi:hypothetical protein